MKVDSVFSKLAAVVLMAVLSTACSTTGTDDSNSTTGSTVSDSGSNGGSTGGGSTAGGNGGSSGEKEMSADDITTVFYFDFDQSTLKSSTRADLNKAAEYLKTTSGSIRLEGHADERGSREYNLALGERRAKAVANYLAIQGVNRNRFDIISYGEEKPARLGSGESSWSKNRRAELKL